MNLIMEALNFLSLRKILTRLKTKYHICINVFSYENNLVYPVYVSNEKFEDCVDLLLIMDNKKSHHVCIKDFNRFTSNKTGCKNKKHTLWQKLFTMFQ